MKTGLLCTTLVLLLASAGAQAQLFKWIGADGKVNYTDQPPPASARSNERKAFAGNSVDQSDFPFELAKAVQAHPVTLYAMPKCLPCDDGRALLKTRGVPYSEKSVVSNEDIAQLRQAGGGSTLPVLLVGASRLQGMEAGAWTAALDSAGYPASSKLPKSYRQTAAEPAAPVPKAITAANEAPAAAEGSTSRNTTPATSSAPPGFRF